MGQNTNSVWKEALLMIDRPFSGFHPDQDIRRPVNYSYIPYISVIATVGGEIGRLPFRD